MNILFTILFAFNTIVSIDSTQTNVQFNVIILPPYDEIAIAGISPRINEYLESALASQKDVRIINLSVKEIIQLNLFNIYDKKYCKDVVEHFRPDIIIMSKIDREKKTGHMETDTWKYEEGIYNPSGNVQINSIKGKNLTVRQMEESIGLSVDELMKDMLNTIK